MEREQIKELLMDILEKEVVQYDPPSLEDWEFIEKKFNCNFNQEFKFFIELMSEYSFPGDILNVSTGNTNGNDSIVFTYDYEMNEGNWESDFIPFYSIGNGDYFCLNSKECPDSPVYYFSHEDYRMEKYLNSFTEWLEGLSEFLE
jgi:hypothetical protein